jgi:hypothetical protein
LPEGFDQMALAERNGTGTKKHKKGAQKLPHEGKPEKQKRQRLEGEVSAMS